MNFPSTHLSLLWEIREGEQPEDAWTAFQSRYRDVILRWCRWGGLGPDTAEDLTQDVLLKLFRELPRHTHDPARGRFRGWLKAVVNNALRDYRRRQRSRPQPAGLGGSTFLERLGNLESPEAAEELGSALEQQTKGLAGDALARVRARVKATTWQAFYLTLVEQRPAKEVAEELGLNVASVYRATFRIKQMVREEYAHGFPESDAAAGVSGPAHVTAIPG